MACTSGNDNIDRDDARQQPPSAAEPEPQGFEYIEDAVVELEADAERINGVVVGEIMAAQRAMTAWLFLATQAAENLVLRPVGPGDAAEDSAAAAGGGGAGSGVRLHPEDEFEKRVVGAMLVVLRDQPMREVHNNLTRVLNGHLHILDKIERLRHSVGAATTPAEASR